MSSRTKALFLMAIAPLAVAWTHGAGGPLQGTDRPASDGTANVQQDPWGDGKGENKPESPDDQPEDDVTGVGETEDSGGKRADAVGAPLESDDAESSAEDASWPEQAAAATDPLDPHPKPQALGDSEVSAVACSFEGIDFVAASTMDGSLAIAVHDDYVYVSARGQGLRRFIASGTDDCALTLDTSFANSGTLEVGSENEAPEYVHTDSDGNIYFRLRFSFYRHGPNGEQHYECQSSNGSYLGLVPGQKWGASFFVGDSIGKVTFDDEGCESEEWPLEHAFRSVHRVVPNSDGTVYIGGGIQEEVNPEKPNKVALFDKDGRELWRAGGDKFGDEASIGWVHDVQPCAQGTCVLDSNYRDLFVFDEAGTFVGEVDLAELFGMHYPWINDFQVVDDAAWFVAANDRKGKFGDQRVSEVVVYKVSGL